MIKRIVLAFVLTLGLTAAACFGIIAWSGALATVTVEERELGPLTLVYREVKGDYGQTPQVLQEVRDSLAGEFGVMAVRGFGLFLNDPAATRAEDLRSLVGWLLDAKDAGKLDLVRAKYGVMEYGPFRSMVADFPFRTRLSPLAGIIRVYPEIRRHAAAKGYRLMPALEIYDEAGATITYSMPVSGLASGQGGAAPLLEMNLK